MRPRLAVLASIREGYRDLGARPLHWLALVAVLQGAVVLLAVPLLDLAFRGILRAAGLASLTQGNALAALTGVAAPLLALLILTALLAVLVQAAVLVIAASGQRQSGDLPTVRAAFERLGTRFAELARRPSTLLLVPYCLLLAPLGQVAIGSALTGWIAVPNFITGELAKSPGGAIGLALGAFLIWYVNLRLILTLPLLLSTDMSAAGAIAASWRLTGWVPWRPLLLTLAVLIPLGVGLLVLASLVLVPTAIADAVAPHAGPLTASVAIAVAQVAAFLLIGFAAALQARIWVAALALAGAEPPGIPMGERRRLERERVRVRVLGAGLTLASLAAVGVLAPLALPAMERAEDERSDVLAHRGWIAGGPENTIPALEAAHAAGASFVEMDVQQTSDGDWVVVHDYSLARLAGIDVAVADLTLDEATAITVREGGLAAPIPSLREYVRRAAELRQPLLIEVKPHGKESPDYLESFLRVLDEEGVTNANLYHSLSGEVVEGLKRLRPELLVGYITAIALGGVPDTPGDFVVVEEWSYSAALRDGAWDEGKGVLVWTVNAASDMRRFLRDGVDGIITDHPDVAIGEREAIAAEEGMTARLLDALDRLLRVP